MTLYTATGMLASRGLSVLTYPELVPSIMECGRSSRSRTERGNHVARLPDMRCALRDHERCAYVEDVCAARPGTTGWPPGTTASVSAWIRRNCQSPAMPAAAPRRHLVHLSVLQLTMDASTARRKAFLFRRQPVPATPKCHSPLSRPCSPCTALVAAERVGGLCRSRGAVHNSGVELALAGKKWPGHKHV